MPCAFFPELPLLITVFEFFCTHTHTHTHTHTPRTLISGLSLADFPTGRWSGSITIAPYTTTGSSYTCLSQCSPITSSSSIIFTGATAQIDIAAGRSPQGCTLNAQRYTIYGLVYHAPNYYGGSFVTPSQTIPVCIFFPGSGSFVITLDGRGTCPYSTSPASCTPGPSGTVIQVWTGLYKRIGVRMRLGMRNVIPMVERWAKVREGMSAT